MYDPSLLSDSCCHELHTAAQASTTVMPMFFAVPSMMFMPASTVVAFRSGILISAISCSAAISGLSVLEFGFAA